MIAMRRAHFCLMIALGGGCADIPQGNWRLVEEETDRLEEFRFCGQLSIEGSSARLVATLPYPYEYAFPDRYWDVTLEGSATEADGVVELTWSCISAAPSPKSPKPASEERKEEACEFFDGWWLRCTVEGDRLSCPSDFLVGEPSDASCEDWQVEP